jgi:hypothetical protein
MAIDPKYGRVTLEHGTVGEDEPVIVFRAQDKLLPMVMKIYAALCEEAGSPERHIAKISHARDQVIMWQMMNATQVPTSESSRAWEED